MMAQNGNADRALTAAAVASFIGGTVSVILFTLFAPPLAAFALKFGPAEEFALMVLAFATFIGLGGDDIPKTIFSILIGLVLATIFALRILGEVMRRLLVSLAGITAAAAIYFGARGVGQRVDGELRWLVEIMGVLALVLVLGPGSPWGRMNIYEGQTKVAH